MKKVFSFVLVLGVAALFSSAALAGADCSYHQTQAAVKQTGVSKEVATAPGTDKTDTNQVRTAEAPQPVKAAPVKK